MTSTAPAVIDALVALAAGTPSGVQALDGPATQDLQEDVVIIGWSGVQGEPILFNTLTQAQLAAEPDRESYDVLSAISCWRGITDFKTVRDRAYELLGELRAGLADDPSLGGAVMEARISAADLTQDQTEAGALAELRFTVHVDAYTT